MSLKEGETFFLTISNLILVVFHLHKNKFYNLSKMCLGEKKMVDFIKGQRQQLQENAFHPGDTQLVKRHTLTLVKHCL